MNNRGFTLLEMMVAVGIFATVMATIVSLSVAFVNAAEIQEIKVSSTDTTWRAFTVLAPIVRQAVRQSVNRAILPGDVLTFRMAADLDGNGFAVDALGAMEATGTITIRRDANDANGDGITMSQLVVIDDAGNVRVLANNLSQGVAGVGAGGGAIPDGVGFWVAEFQGGYVVTIRTEGRTRQGRVFTTEMTELIVPKNSF